MKKSISNILNFRITLAVICVNLIIGLFFYAFSSHLAEEQFKKSIELHMKSLGDTFAQQLWLFDLSSAEQLVNLTLESPEFKGLRLLDNEENILIEKGSFNEESLEFLRKELRFKDENLVGYLELAYTHILWKGHNSEVLVASICMVGATILLTILIVSFFLNYHLKRPLRELQQDMDSLADGHFKSSRLVPKTLEIQSIIDVFNRMAHSLAAREAQRDKAQAKSNELENQLYQSQKIEAVGRLAGGVAHDYNNMLGVILGYAELGLMKIDPSDPLRDDLDQILAAAKRSRDITRQLLAFARKQTIAPKVLDLNVNVEKMLKMLRNLLGENIDLVWQPKQNLWPIKIDPTLLDQILANLCVNARDAITGNGKMTIETDEIRIDQAYCENHPGFIPGDFVMLTVSDDGCGMDKETVDNIFEPFFTTKQVGEGTGLGLATVYGIVKQSDGFLNVYSEPGQGTTFKIYLPRHEGVAEVEQKVVGDEVPLKGHGEIVLVVEDERSILEMTSKLLHDLGYKVLTANSPSEALSLAEEHSKGLKVLLTDVVMPEMNGRVLAHRLRLICPELKCLYMSGYTANVIAHHGVLDEGIQFIQKPFSKVDLSTKIREVLGSNGSDQ